METNEEHWVAAELMRLKACVLRDAGRVDDARRGLSDALELAREQGARLWELRVATSLARLWQSQRKTAVARDILAPVYDCFTEGIDTPDLVEAKALLEELKPG